MPGDDGIPHGARSTAARSGSAKGWLQAVQGARRSIGRIGHHRSRLARTVLGALVGVTLLGGLVAIPIGSGTAGMEPSSGFVVRLGPALARAASGCTGWTSQTTPPQTIRVLRTGGPADGTVQTVPFQDYVNVVMAAEWGASDPVEALKAGAVAVKQYAWYWTMNWRGGTAADGSCYDVVDNSMDQVYAPETHTPSASEIAAVTDTWGISMLKSGALFAAHYDAGSDVACGANANGWQLLQISAMQCAEQGMLAAQILMTYYGPNVTIVGADTGGVGGAGVPALLRFTAQPSAATAGVALSTAPAVTVVDDTGQTVTTGAGATTMVTLAIGAGPQGAALTCQGGATRAAVAGIATFDGCSVSPAGGGYVLVATAPGLPAAASTPFVAAPAAPTLTLEAASTVIRWGDPAQLSVHLVPPASGGTVAGQVVHLQRSTDGVDWTTAADLTTDSQGTATWSERPATNLFFRAVFDGSAELAAVTGAPVRVLVRQLALLRPDNAGTVRAVARGTTVTFTTLVRPARPELAPGRVLYRVYQLVGRTWILRREATVTADAAGRATLPVSFGTAGSWYVRAIALPTPANANSVWSPLERYAVR